MASPGRGLVMLALLSLWIGTAAYSADPLQNYAVGVALSIDGDLQLGASEVKVTPTGRFELQQFGGLGLEILPQASLSWNAARPGVRAEFQIGQRYMTPTLAVEAKPVIAVDEWGRSFVFVPASMVPSVSILDGQPRNPREPFLALNPIKDRADRARAPANAREAAPQIVFKTAGDEPCEVPSAQLRPSPDFDALYEQLIKMRLKAPSMLQ